MSAIDDFDASLDVLIGATSGLDASEKSALDERGYHVFESRLGAEPLARLVELFEARINKSSSPTAGPQSGTRHIQDLVGAGASVLGLATDPLLVAGVRHVFRDPFRVSSISGRDPLPGFGQQGLHADWGPRFDASRVEAVTALWLLDAFGADSGATRVVPGTHRLKNSPPKSLASPAARHPEEVRILAPAGSLLLLNGHLWHSGTRNDSGLRRRVVQCSYVARHHRAMAMPAPPGLPQHARFLFED